MGFIDKGMKVIMNTLLADLQMYFIVNKYPDSEGYDFMEMAFSLRSAQEIVAGLHEREDSYAPEILELNMDRMLTLAKAVGIVEKVG